MADRPFTAAESAELLLLAEEIGRIGIIDWQIREGTVRLSPKALELYGLTQFDGRYDTWISTVHREDVVRLRDVIDTALDAREREFELEFRVVRPSDNTLRWLHARRLAFYDVDGTPIRVVGVSVDITDRKRAAVEARAFTETLEDAVRARTRELEAENEARRRAEDSLRQAQKMEAVGQLTGGVAHDFNNLLTLVIGGLDVIGQQLNALPASAATSRIVRAKDMALQGAQRATTLTSRLLAFSRQQALSPQNLDVNKLVAGMSDFLHRTLGEQVALETVLGGGLWHAFADPSQIENAILNLALNARDAMPEGGKLTVETANCYLDQAYVAKLSEPVQPGQYVMIAVGDTGAGMPPSTVERAFDPFFTTKEVGKGTGLGLSQVYGFVRQSSGHIKIYSEVGEGTTVKIYLPRHTGSGNPKSDIVPQLASATGHETILVVEDDEALRHHSTEIVAELGYRAVSAANAAVALQILENENVDLLFTDVVLPGGINGRQLAETAKHRKPSLKVLFTSGYTRNAIVHHGRLDEGVQLIGKPYSINELATKIRKVLDEMD